MQIQSPPDSYSDLAYSGTALSCTSAVNVRRNPIGQHEQHGCSVANVRPVPIGQAAVSSPEVTKRQMVKFDGFNSVREALLRTSSVIKDIDQLLEKK